MDDFLQSFQNLTISNPDFCCYVGALILHIFSLYDKNFHGTHEFFMGIFPNKRIDFILLPLIGTLLAVILITPSGPAAGMFAGLSWSGTLVAVLKRKNAPQGDMNAEVGNG